MYRRAESPHFALLKAAPVMATAAAETHPNWSLLTVPQNSMILAKSQDRSTWEDLMLVLKDRFFEPHLPWFATISQWGALYQDVRNSRRSKDLPKSWDVAGSSPVEETRLARSRAVGGPTIPAP